MEKLTGELSEQFRKSEELEKEIRKSEELEKEIREKLADLGMNSNLKLVDSEILEV